MQALSNFTIMVLSICYYEFVAVELCTIIENDGVGDFILVDDVLVDDLLDLCGHYGGKRFYFNLFSEVVNSHYYVLYTTSPFRKPTD